jgi:hypothetical protein
LSSDLDMVTFPSSSVTYVIFVRFYFSNELVMMTIKKKLRKYNTFGPSKNEL